MTASKDCPNRRFTVLGNVFSMQPGASDELTHKNASWRPSMQVSACAAVSLGFRGVQCSADANRWGVINRRNSVWL